MALTLISGRGSLKGIVTRDGSSSLSCWADIFKFFGSNVFGDYQDGRMRAYRRYGRCFIHLLLYKAGYFSTGKHSSACGESCMKADDIGVYLNPINTVAFEIQEALQTPAVTAGRYHIEWLTITYGSPLIHPGARSGTNLQSIFSHVQYLMQLVKSETTKEQKY
jgi:hypothetical protein